MRLGSQEDRCRETPTKYYRSSPTSLCIQIANANERIKPHIGAFRNTNHHAPITPTSILLSRDSSLLALIDGVQEPTLHRMQLYPRQLLD